MAETGSFLAVLKLFGDKPSPGLLSFPMPGATFALDFPNNGRETLRLLDQLDDVIQTAVGAHLVAQRLIENKRIDNPPAGKRIDIDVSFRRRSEISTICNK